MTSVDSVPAAVLSTPGRVVVKTDFKAEHDRSVDFIRDSYKVLHGEYPPEGIAIDQIVQKTIEKHIENQTQLLKEHPEKASSIAAASDENIIEKIGHAVEHGVSSALEFLHLKTPRSKASWENWNKNQFTTGKVEIPLTLPAIQEVVKNNPKVRVAAFAHSWSPIVVSADDTETMLINTSGVLKGIISTKEEILRTKSITFECGVSIQNLEDWLRAHDIPLTVAANVVLTEVFMSGVTASLCHGAGYEWGSVADFVASLTIVDAEGAVTTYTDRAKEQIPIPKDNHLYETIKIVSKDEMNIQRGALGLTGVIYALTVDLIEEDTLVVTDQLYPVENVMDAVKMKELVESRNGWVEIFWVPNSPNLWVKSWKRAPKGTKPEVPHHAWWDCWSTYMTHSLYALRQKAQKLGIDVPVADATYLSMIYHGMTIGMTEKGKSVNWKWFDSIHYKGNINDMLVEDTEFAFPVDENYENPSKAFRTMKDLLDEHSRRGDFPVDIVCEMRFTGGSNAALAHFPASKHPKWQHIEFLSYTVEGIPKLEKRWNAFVQQLAAKWVEQEGHPHWAKGWQKVAGIQEYIAKKVVTNEFRDYLKKVDPHGKFMNKSLASIFHTYN